MASKVKEKAEDVQVCMPFQRYKFKMRQQEAGESFDHYMRALQQLARKCAFETVTAHQLSILDSCVKERLFREDILALEKAQDLCRASEMTQA